MKLYMMKKSALDTLKSNMDIVYSKYYLEDSNEWMWDVCGENPFIEIADASPFDLASLTLARGDLDAENCKILYANLKKYISPSQASDERLWAGLCNGTFYDYMRERWNMYGDFKDDDKAACSNILSRFFITGGVRKGSYRNTLSKCWWIGYKLYDNENKDHFWRIDALGHNDFSTKVSDLFTSYNYASNIEITDGVIQAISYFNDKGIKLKQKEHIRTSLQLLNAIGGSVILDGLCKDEIAKIIIDNIETIIAGEKTALTFIEDEEVDAE